MLAQLAKELTGNTRFLLQGGFESSKGCVFAVVMHASKSTPAFFVKMARAPGTNFLAREQTNIEFVRNARDKKLCPCMPVVKSFSRRNDHEFLVLEYFEGHKLSDSFPALDKNRQESTLREITGWCAALTNCSRSPLSKEMFEQLIANPMRTFLSSNSSESYLKPKIEQSLTLLENNFSGLFAAFEHGDFQGNNILHNTTGDYCFVDWESGTTHGLPAVDLFHLLYNIESSHSHAKDCMTAYIKDLGLSMELIPSLYIAFLVRKHLVNLSQRVRTRHHLQDPLLAMIYGVPMNFDFRFIF